MSCSHFSSLPDKTLSNKNQKEIRKGKSTFAITIWPVLCGRTDKTALLLLPPTLHPSPSQMQRLEGRNQDYASVTSNNSTACVMHSIYSEINTVRHIIQTWSFCRRINLLSTAVSSIHLFRLLGQGKLLENLTSPDKSSETTISSSLF